MQTRPLIEIRRRLAAADPTATIPVRFTEFVFKTLQWLAFSALIEAVGRKLNDPTVRYLGYFLNGLLTFVVAWVTWKATTELYKPHGFSTRIKRTAARLVAVLFSVMATAYLLRALRDASTHLVEFYGGK